MYSQILPKTRAKIKPKNSETAIATAKLPDPQKGKQQQFYDCDADIVFYGGSAGSGKTVAVLLDAAKPEYLKDPEYRAVVFRRTYPEIKNPGGILDESQKYYYGIQGQLTQNPLDWRFPSGARIAFRHIQHEKTVYEYQGSQIGTIYFDELTHFSDKIFFYMLSRNRSSSGIKSKVRGTCNPDAESWVANFISWYIGDDGFPISDRAGVIRYFIRINEEVIWGDTKDELLDRYPNSKPKSFTFIPALITDNPILLEKDPEYLGNLEAQHPVDKERLLKGNWKVKYEAGTVFDRTWFSIVDELPKLTNNSVEARFWDLAATAKEVATKDHYYSAGCRGVSIGNDIYITDLIAEQRSPGALDDLLIATADLDGSVVLLRWELEGGSAGKLYENDLVEKLQEQVYGIDAKAVKPLGDKVTRALPAANAANQGRIKLLRAPWNKIFLSAVSQFDGSKKPLTNDVVDAFDGLYQLLNNTIVYESGELAQTKTRDTASTPATQDIGFTRTRKTSRSRGRGRR